MIRLYEDIPLKNGIKLIDTNHSIERFFDKNRFTKDQRTDISNNIKTVSMNTLDWLVSNRAKQGIYGVHSVSIGIGFVIDYRKDYKSNDDKKHLILITLLPIKPKHFFRDIDLEIIVESLLEEFYMTNLTDKEKLNENILPDYVYIRYDEKTFSIIKNEDTYESYDLSKFLVFQ